MTRATTNMTTTTEPRMRRRVATARRALLLAPALAIACASPPLPQAAVPAPAGSGAATPAPVVVAAAEKPPAIPAPPEEPRPPARVTPDAPFRAQPPAAGPETPFTVPRFKRFKLKSGIGVILSEVHDLPLIEVHMLVKTGGGANPPGAAGLADLTANMLDEGTKTRSALDIAEQMGALGASLGTAASWDASTVSMSTIARSFDAALAIWADVITQPAFAEKELARVRDNLITAVSRRKDSPPTVASLVFARLLFGDRHPYAWPQSGTEETLKKLTVGEVRKFYEAYYHPNNATIIVAGDITEAELRKKLEAALKTWRPGRIASPAIPPLPALDKKRIVLVDKPGAPQSSVRVGFAGVKRTDPDYFPILLMNQILGGTFYRLDMNLRERQQWTYGARSAFEMRRSPGLATAGGEFVAPHTADAVAEILKEMRIMATTEVTDEELGRAKDNFAKAFPARFATRASTAAQLGELAVYGLPDNFLATYVKNINAVTKADIAKAAQRFLMNDKMLIVVVGDRATQETALGKLGTLELRDLDGNLLPAAPPPTAKGASPKGADRD